MGKLLLSVLFVALCFGISSAQPDFSNQFDYALNLSSGLGMSQTGYPPVAWYYMLYYSVRGGNITFGVVCGVRNATDWCGIGWSNGGGMVGSDAVVGTFNQTSGQAQVFDLILDNSYEPSSSGNNAAACVGAVCSDQIYFVGSYPCTNNVYDVSGSYTPATGQSPPGYLYYRFTRPLAASDLCDIDVNVAPSNTSLIFSVGNQYSNGSFPVTMQKHYYTLQSDLEPWDVTFQQMPSPSPSPSTGSSPSSSPTPSPSRTPSVTPSTTPAVAASTTPSSSPAPPSASSSPDATSDSNRLSPLLSGLLDLII